jgi:serine/threonine-protein kinase
MTALESTDANLLFAVLALQGDLIDAARFVEGCTAWAARKDRPLADLLVERGWISEDDRRLVRELMERKLRRHDGDAEKGLRAAAASSSDFRRTVASLREGVEDGDLQRTLAGLDAETAGSTRGYEYLADLGRPSPVSPDRYTLTTLHAKGGIGQVWLARDSEMGREVALKELRPEQAGDDRALRRFLLEAKITGRLDHPGVVPVYELATIQGDGERPYYTMRFIRGRTLADAIAAYHKRRAEGRARRTDLLELIQAFVGVCNTVAFAHSKGVIHRDLKGQNIVLGEFGEVILLDWGLAKLLDAPKEDDEPDDEPPDPLATAAWAEADAPADEALTAAGQVLGTPGFMAPEQAEGRRERIGRATDVYGLGAILYAILTGKPPFEGANAREVLRKVREEAPTPPRRLNRDAPRPLEAACLKAIARVPEARYASAAALAEDVKHWVADEPVSAWREPWTTRARRWIGRHRTGVVAAVSVLFVAAVGLTVFAYAQRQSNVALQRAIDRESTAAAAASDYSAEADRAIQAFYSGITSDVILRRPELKELRDRLLGTALDFYEARVRALSDPRRTRSDEDARYNVTVNLDRIATLYSLLGDRDAAIKTRERMIQDIRTHQAFEQYRDAHLANAYNTLGNLQRLAGRPDDATRSLRESLALYESVNQRMPSEAKVALARADLGRHLFDVGRAAEGLRLLEEARAVQESIIPPGSSGRANPTVAANLAATLMTLGNCHEAEGRLDEALARYQQSADLYERLRREIPGQAAYYRVELARTRNNLGLALARAGRVEAGRAEVERGREERRSLFDDQPLNIESRADLARSEYHLARVELLAGAPDEALGAIDRAEALYEGIPPKGPEDLYFRAALRSMRSGLIGAGTPDADRPDAERAARREAADEAMRLLKEAAAAGYANRTRFAQDPSLEPLRDRPDFQALIRSLPEG